MVARLKINHATMTQCEVQVLINGEFVGQLNMRNGQLVPFMLRFKPVGVEVDSENTTDDIRRRLQGFPQVKWF